MASNSEPPGVPVEVIPQDPQVYDIETAGVTHLEPQLTAQEEMTRQISRLWEAYANFQGLPSDIDSDSSDGDEGRSPKALEEEREEGDLANGRDGAAADQINGGGGDLDAYAVRAKVHEQLLLAQSEIQVSLDMVRLLVAAKKRAARDAMLAAVQSATGGIGGGGAQGSKLTKHDQHQHQQPTAAAAAAAGISLDADAQQDEVTVGGLPFPVGILDTIRTDASSTSYAQGSDSAAAAQKRREDELKLVLGAKYRQLDSAANTLQSSSARLRRVAARESVFWRTAFEMRRRNWVVQQQRQLAQSGGSADGGAMRMASVPGYADRYFVRYGYADSGSSFADDMLAELIRDTGGDGDGDGDGDGVAATAAGASDGKRSPDAMEVDNGDGGFQPSSAAAPSSAPTAAPLYIPKSDTRHIQVRLNSMYKQPAAQPSASSSSSSSSSDSVCAARFADNGEFVSARREADATAFDQAHHKLLRARRAAFDRELYYRLCKEARVLELGFVRASARKRSSAQGAAAALAAAASLQDSAAQAALASSSVHDTLVTTLSRDNVGVRFEWILDEEVEEEGALAAASQPPGGRARELTFVQWQCNYYARLALVMAAMYQRRMHRAVKDYYLGSGLDASALVSASAAGAGARGIGPPDAFVAVRTGGTVPPAAAAAAAAAAAPGSGGSFDAQEHNGGGGPPFKASSSAAAGAGPGAGAGAGASGAGVVAGASGAGSGSVTAPATPATPSGNMLGESIAAPSAAAAAAAAASSGAVLPAPGSLAAAGPGAGAALPAATITAEPPSGGTAFAVSRPDLLVLAPVLQSVQFAKWQHILSATIQRACAAWQRLVEEPIEVVGHFARIYRTPRPDPAVLDPAAQAELRDFCRTGARAPGSSSDPAGDGKRYCQGMCYAMRLRFLGGTVMAFHLEDSGTLIFAKGYFPPPVPAAAQAAAAAAAETSAPAAAAEAAAGDAKAGASKRAGSVLWSRPEQMFIHRVFRIVPLSGLGEFVDQLRRELQSLVLLRAAAALSRRSHFRRQQQRTDHHGACQMGQWYVHQAQLCVVGEWWEGARHRQIVGVAKWGEPAASSKSRQSGASCRGLGDHSGAWDLALYFGPKHPTAFDAAAGARLAGSIVPWVVSYPPPPPPPAAAEPEQQQQQHTAAAAGENKTFEQKLFNTLVSAF